MEKITTPDTLISPEQAGQSAIEKLKALAKAAQENRASAEKPIQAEPSVISDENAKEAIQLEQGNRRLAENYIKGTKGFLPKEEGGGPMPEAYDKELGLLRAKEGVLNSEISKLKGSVAEAEALLADDSLSGLDGYKETVEAARTELQSQRELLGNKEKELSEVSDSLSGLRNKWIGFANSANFDMRNSKSFAADQVISSRDPKFNQAGGWEISDSKKVSRADFIEKMDAVNSAETKEKQEEFEKSFSETHFRILNDLQEDLERAYVVVSDYINENKELLETNADIVRRYNQKRGKAEELRNKKYFFNKEEKMEKDRLEAGRLDREAQEYLSGMQAITHNTNNEDLSKFYEVARSARGGKRMNVNMPTGGQMEVDLVNPAHVDLVYKNDNRRTRLKQRISEISNLASNREADIGEMIREYNSLLDTKMPH